MIKIIINSFKNALRGIISAVISERHMRFHLVAAAYALYFSSFYNFSKAEYAVLFLVIGLVISAELLNTAIEANVDLTSPSYHEKAKISKDTAASSVLIAAVCSIAVGVLLFFDLNIIKSIIVYFSSIFRLLILILSIVISYIFVFVLFKSKKQNVPENVKEKK